FIVSSTTWAQSGGPEDSTALCPEFQSASETSLKAIQGLVDRLIADAVYDPASAIGLKLNAIDKAFDARDAALQAGNCDTVAYDNQILGFAEEVRQALPPTAAGSSEEPAPAEPQGSTTAVLGPTTSEMIQTEGGGIPWDQVFAFLSEVFFGEKRANA